MGNFFSGFQKKLVDGSTQTTLFLPCCLGKCNLMTKRRQNQLYSNKSNMQIENVYHNSGMI